jgi:hypothetical protein
MSIDLQKAFEADEETEQKEHTEFVENETVDNFFDNVETPESEVKQDEVIQPAKNDKKDKKSKDNAIDVQDVSDEEVAEVFGQTDFFDEEEQ